MLAKSKMTNPRACLKSLGLKFQQCFLALKLCGKFGKSALEQESLREGENGEWSVSESLTPGLSHL